MAAHEELSWFKGREGHGLRLIQPTAQTSWAGPRQREQAGGGDSRRGAAVII